MKRIISLFIILVALVGCMTALASCNDTDVCQHRDADDDGLCDKCGDGYTDGKDLPDEPACQHRDADDNGKCDECGEDFEDGKDFQETDISSASLKVIGDTITGIVSNSQETFSFLNDITVANGASYVVARDVFCENVIHTKNAPLTIGDNTLYILVTSGNDMKLYTVTIRRRPMYTVSFDTGKGGSIASQTVEEGNVATEPTETPTLSGCTFSEWDYDFSTPVTDNIKISAKYNVIPEMAIFDFTSTETTCTITGIKSADVTELTIPEIVTSISSSAFEGCSLLTNITVDENNGNYKSIDGNLYTKDGKVLVKYASGKTDASFTIPNSVTKIGNSAFYGCSSLTSVTIPDSVTSIGDYAFSGCHITYASIPASVISYIPKGYLKEVVITSGTKIGNYAFRDCSSLTSITIPDSVTSIGDYAFSGCHITYASIPASVIWRIPKGYFKEVVITSGTKIGSGAFDDCSSLTSVTIPDSITEIGDYAFRGCSSLTSVTIPDSVTSIGVYAFRDCSSLTSITIPDSVTSIGKYAFQGCSSLTSVTIGNSVTSIGDYAFWLCSSLTSVTIPDSVTEIGRSAFSNCSSLSSVTIPDSVTSIGKYAFYNCSSLTSVTIPNSVTSIGSSAFYNCSSLTIYCEAKSKPSGWSDDWNYSNCPVVWGYTDEE